MSKQPTPVRQVADPGVAQATANLALARQELDDAQMEHVESRAALERLLGHGSTEATLASAQNLARQATEKLERARSNHGLREKLVKIATAGAAEVRFAKADLGVHGVAEQGDGATFDAETYALRFVRLETLAALEHELGASPMLEGARRLAEHLGERAAVDEGTAVDAIRAHAAIASAKSDPELMAKIMERQDPTARAEWSRLHEQAYPRLPDE